MPWMKMMLKSGQRGCDGLESGAAKDALSDGRTPGVVNDVKAVVRVARPRRSTAALLEYVGEAHYPLSIVFVPRLVEDSSKGASMWGVG